jgi:indolepyruvate ferredoxin oxidoreductase beta subunit
VKFGDKVYSPIIDKGEADVVLAFEMLEAYRALPFVKKDGKILVNRQEMNPMPVITGAMTYPENIEEKLSAKVNVEAIDALELARQAGTAKAVNVVLIGFLAKSMDIEKEIWLDVIKECVPPKFLEMNLKAFELGYESNN